MLPGIIKPLVWSVNTQLVNSAWIELFTELIGPNDIQPGDLAKSFYYRAYFNMSVIGDVLEMTGFPRETLELLMGVDVTGPERPKFKPSGKTYRLLPRLLWFVFKKLSISSEINRFYQEMERDYRSIPVDKIDQMDEKELFEQIETLFVMTQETAYYTINTMLLMQVYNNLLKNRLTKQGVDYESFDMTHNFDELKEMDPITHLKRLAAIYQELPPIQQVAIKEANFDEFIQLQGINDLQQGVHHFIEQFGHLSDSGNDFSQTPWSENPDVVLRMLLNEVKADAKSSKQIKIDDLNLSTGGRLFLGVLYRRARQFLLYREQVGSLFTFGFGLFRKYFLSLGEQFFKRELISAPNDIFFLTFDEIRIGINKFAEEMNYVNIVESRKVELENYRDITPPTTIYGDQPIPLEDSAGNVLEGTPTSRGYYRGPAKIVRGISDIEVVSAGDVLVVPYSDVGWTPMFTKAGAIVAESGGILSHSSIVAREYGIPAVVSVPGACKLLQKKMVTVDGFQGRVIIHD